jgi:hypothetical protein
MTCIAGISLSNGEVWIAGDSAGTNASSQQTLYREGKVFVVRNAHGDEFLLGCGTSFRMMDLLRYTLVPPPYEEEELHRYMVVGFVEAVRACLEAGGWARKEANREEGGTFLVGFRGRLFEISPDYQICEALIGYHAIGTGDDLALGALFATQGNRDPQNRLMLALQAAAYHNSDVREPFVIQHLRPAAVSPRLLEPTQPILVAQEQVG